jgi:hypothetical protein
MISISIIFVLLFVVIVKCQSHGKKVLSANARLEIKLEVKGFYLKEDHDFTTAEDISFEFKNWEVTLPYKDKPQVT